MQTILLICLLFCLFHRATCWSTSPPLRTPTKPSQNPDQSTENPNHFSPPLTAFKVALSWFEIENAINGSPTEADETPNFQFAPMTEWPPISDSKIWPPMPSSTSLSSQMDSSEDYGEDGSFVIEDDITISRKILRNLKKIMHL
ncbi:hypothetical protein TrLO_g13231 [Triparma laevis f. longispina]|uniref:Uncharacterized protein n=1 Tax=Triparma laevis f. longispina TaxID=1714387 RepID=A0A9W7CN44_9STRA|nr:hypothetical protein TrLO_g13231 [Triparma laevis f. longispina]